MSPRKCFALRNYLGADRPGRTISDARSTISLTGMLSQSCLGGRAQQLSARAVLLALFGQLLSALAMIKLDGTSRRMLLCPPDLDPAHLDQLIHDAEIDAVVTDRPECWKGRGIALVVEAGLPAASDRRAQSERTTEWLTLTSGTSGAPKIVKHTLDESSGAIVADGARGPAAVWATFYDIRRYGGLQILLRAVIGGGSMVLSELSEALAESVARFKAHGLTHISGTPSHWRKFRISGAAAGFAPAYVRLSGEIADQPVLDELRHAFPSASIGHAYASTEAGLGFAVTTARKVFRRALSAPIATASI